MRRKVTHFALVAFLVVSSTLLLQAQRGGAPAHIGGATRAAPTSASPARTFAPPSRTFFSGPAHSPTFKPLPPGHRPGGISLYPPNRGVGYRRNYPIVYAGYPWLFPFGYGFSGDDESGDQGVYQPPPQAGEPPPAEYGQMAENGPSPFRPEYQGPAGPPPEPPRDQPTTTLIFKDGRPPVQVQNYALTATTLFALDGDLRKEIPLSLLNVQATVETNRSAGVDFALPVSR
jgi:hypothetical protein